MKKYTRGHTYLFKGKEVTIITSNRPDGKVAIDLNGEIEVVNPDELTEVGKKAKATEIKKVADNQVKRLAKYRVLRDEYFAEHPICEFPACNEVKITLHHKKGRLGSFLTDKRTFCSLCDKHHRWVEENPLEAKKMGLSDLRLDKTD